MGEQERLGSESGEQEVRCTHCGHEMAAKVVRGTVRLGELNRRLDPEGFDPVDPPGTYLSSALPLGIDPETGRIIYR